MNNKTSVLLVDDEKAIRNFMSASLSTEGYRIIQADCGNEMQLGEMGDAVAVEWPKGQSMKVAAVVSEGSLNVSVREAGDWFGVSGELRVREDLVLNMRALLERIMATDAALLCVTSPAKAEAKSIL